MFDKVKLIKKSVELEKRLAAKMQEVLPEEELEMMAELEMIKDKIRKLNYDLTEVQLEAIIQAMTITESEEEIKEEFMERGKKRLELIIKEDEAKQNAMRDMPRT